jgi:RNA recognition motif-containing protein
LKKEENTEMKGSKLYVGNLNYDAAEPDLEKVFAEHGTVKSVKIIEGRGFGFVEMGETAEAEKAMNELNGTEFMGRTLVIDEAHPPKKDNR